MPAPSADSTPVRLLDATVADGVRVLSDPQSNYRDGAEESLLTKVRAARDVSSLSDELMRAAEGWAETYHLSTSRAHLLRALEIPADARVLEVGAGCGSITRWLGERCTAVDALEPVLARARVARERCRDLPGVQVFAGAVDDVPAEPAYDLVVVVGVLEYVGAGTAEPTPYRQFLDALRARLRPGGTLVLAIENRIGVKYLAGAPEDHSGRIFDSLEGYPYGTPARTFTAAELTGLLRGAGFPQLRTLGAFPDYKLTRVLLDGGLADVDPTMLHRLPRWPSPDWQEPRPRLADEALLWRTLVDAGRPIDFANSFVVVAGDARSAPVWPESRLACWLSAQRRAPFQTRAVLDRAGDGAAVTREPLLGRDPAGQPVQAGAGRTLWCVPSSEPHRPGRDLMEVLAGAGAEERVAALGRWVALVRDACPDGAPVPLDLVPHNLLVGEDGQLTPIDQEWFGTGWSVSDVLGRGVLWLAYGLAAVTPPGRWSAPTIGELANQFAAEAGLPADWLVTTREAEVDFQAAVYGLDPEVPAGDLRGLLDTRLVDLGLGERLPERAHRLEAELAAARADLAAAREELAAGGGSPAPGTGAVAPAEAGSRGEEAARALIRRYRAVVERIAPAGSLRRRTYARLAHRRRPA